jgi:hypothetical protein
MRTFSKSKLVALRQCPKRLWLEIHRLDLRADITGTQERLQAGHSVGEIARQIYDPDSRGALIDIEAEGFPQAFARSAALLQLPQTIFEAGFSAGGALAFADVMLPVSQTLPPRWRMVEVKSSTHVKDSHLDDVAVQSFAAKAAGVELAGIAIACIDSAWVYPGGGDYRGLLKEHDLTSEAQARQAEVTSWIAQAQDIAGKEQAPAVAIGAHCDIPYECGFYGHCSQDEPQPEYPVYWLPRISRTLVRELAEDGVDDMRHVPDEQLNDRQQRVKRHTLDGSVYFDALGAAEDLAHFPLPAQFLDFETIQFAVPLWAGTRPYQQIPFQYSLHTLSADGVLRHTEFLSLDGSDPSLGLAQALVADCAQQAGPVFAYNASFEVSRIRELADRFPQHAEALLAINARMVDLLPIARERYYHPSQHGSWSIKAVLPAVVPALRYSDLEGVKDGGMAMDAFLEALHPQTSTDRKHTLQQQLLAYCKLDTYAMVKLWQVFAGRTDLEL